mmetsp:Transcript_47113/g.89963  ORF Transcript_47113/g.89963 Transcript_47113/m.89963 type:complete len:391 (-) Transcript_47113:815-1987(-)
MYLEIKIRFCLVQRRDEVRVGRPNLSIRDQEHVRIGPLCRFQTCKAAPQGLVHVGAAVERHGQKHKELLQTLGIHTQLHLLHRPRPTEGVEEARAFLRVRLAETLEGERLGHRLAPAHHAAGGVQAHHHRASRGRRPRLHAIKHTGGVLEPAGALVGEQRALDVALLHKQPLAAGPCKHGGLAGQQRGEVARSSQAPRLVGLHVGARHSQRPTLPLHVRASFLQRTLPGATPQLAHQLAQLLQLLQFLAQRVQLLPAPLLPQAGAHVEAGGPVHEAVEALERLLRRLEVLHRRLPLLLESIHELLYNLLSAIAGAVAPPAAGLALLRLVRLQTHVHVLHAAAVAAAAAVRVALPRVASLAVLPFLRRSLLATRPGLALGAAAAFILLPVL